MFIPSSSQDQPLSNQSKPDVRHLKRASLMQQVFATLFSEETTRVGVVAMPVDYRDINKSRLPFDEKLQEETEKILEQIPQIDALLQQHAPERPLNEINQVDLAILRIIIWESFTKNTPRKVLIDEAIELAKEYGSESSPRFVNGVLGKLLMGVKGED